MPKIVLHGATLVFAGMLLVSAGQPLFTEDAWWHLAMGEAYARDGPWLSADPTLYTAVGPPAPAAWLADVGLHGIANAFGFIGLRIAHALAVASVLGLGWSLLRRASGSASFASLGLMLFGALSAYRLFQLRPHLFSILAAILLVRWLLVDGSPPGRLRVAAAIALMALWANLHAAFVLGPVLLVAALGGLGIHALVWPESRPSARERALPIAWALGLGTLATLANPAGLGPHLLFFSAGVETPALGLVADEWAAPGLLRLPVPRLPPSPLAWATLWGLLIVTPCAVLLHERRRRGAVDPPRTAERVDPALVAVAAVAFVAMLFAVRFLWMGLFPLLVVGQCVGAAGAPRPRWRGLLPWATGLAGVLLVPAFGVLGAWPMISQGIERSRYAAPYPAVKYHAHAVWFLRDAGLEGNLFNDYSSGNFLGYWLAPRLRGFINGSLNVPVEVFRAGGAVANRRGLEPGESFTDLLDRHGVDVFFGTGVPAAWPPSRPTISMTTHLENTPGWKLVFRNLRSAVYVRDDERNRANLERIVGFYEREGVPFDLEGGFEAEGVVKRNLPWAVAHGLVPADFDGLGRAVFATDSGSRRLAQERLAGVYAVLGLYERAVATDRARLRAEPSSLAASRRLVWSLLHQIRLGEASSDYDGLRAAAEALAETAAPGDGLSRNLIDAALRLETLSHDEARSLVAVLPYLARGGTPWLLAGYREPAARTQRAP